VEDEADQISPSPSFAGWKDRDVEEQAQGWREISYVFACAAASGSARSVR
jgi:hypothetical protein